MSHRQFGLVEEPIPRLAAQVALALGPGHGLRCPFPRIGAHDLRILTGKQNASHASMTEVSVITACYILLSCAVIVTRKWDENLGGSVLFENGAIFMI